MTALDPGDVARALTRKGMTPDPTRDHVWYSRTTPCGIELHTKISHGAKSIGDKLVALMAKQCQLTNGEFRELVKCRIEQPRWDELVKLREETDTLRYTGR